MKKREWITRVPFLKGKTGFDMLSEISLLHEVTEGGRNKLGPTNINW